MPSPALLVRLRPAGPWRLAHSSGLSDRVDYLLRSDTLFSALSCAMRQLGLLDEWLQATVEMEEPVLRISSGYPFSGQILYIAPPRHTWPPAASGKVRWKAARLVPISLVSSLLRGDALDPDRWVVDPMTGCLLPVGRNGISSPPYRIATRSGAPVDRIDSRSSEAFSAACLEFASNAGIWCVSSFRDENVRGAWMPRLRGAFRLLADEGIGAGRSRGWGHSLAPQFQDVKLPDFLVSEAADQGESQGHWLISLFSPASSDEIDWSRGDYSLLVRKGRTMAGTSKMASKMVEEGSVLFASKLSGTARDVAGAGAEHASYRNGVALALPIAVRSTGVKYRSALASAAVSEDTAPSEEPTREQEPPQQEPPFDQPGPDEPPQEEPSPEDPPDEDSPREDPPPSESPAEDPPPGETAEVS